MLIRILRIFCIRQNFQCDFRTNGFLIAGINGIAIRALGLPDIRCIGTKCTCFYRNTASYHKGRIETNAKLTDDLVIVLQFVFSLKLERTAVGDNAQVVLQLLFGHTNSVIGNGQGSCLRIYFQVDGKIGLAHIHAVIRQRTEVELVNCITCIGNQFPQENFLMCINRMNHHVQQTLGFRLKCFLFHIFNPHRTRWDSFPMF